MDDMVNTRGGHFAISFLVPNGRGEKLLCRKRQLRFPWGYSTAFCCGITVVQAFG